ncbi:MAG: hypothetical protein JWM81_866 [Candidatus Saccharibacteria bacterium]|nr:hypothetical protein [Candidatus Saccharibacteria bacterium]
MNKIKITLRGHWLSISCWLITVLALITVLGYHLGTLVPGLSSSEQAVAITPLGWSGIYADPLNLPLLLLRSIAFFFHDGAGAFVTRAPNAVLGAVAVVALMLVVKFWHGTRIALLTGVLFGSAAWTLHISRYASTDVLYLLLVPLLLLTQVLIKQQSRRLLVVCAVMLTWGVLLYVPGFVWLLLVTIFWQRKLLRGIWSIHTALKPRLLIIACGLVTLPLLIIRFINEPRAIISWLGLPQDFGSLGSIGHGLLAVPVHVFVHGPAIPELWLGRLPILDVFTLALAVLGIFFYVARNWFAPRTQQLLSYAVVGLILIGLGGPVTLSVVIPLAYLAAAAGIAWLLRDWLRTFPINPFARSIGIGLITLAVLLSAGYNLRSYFIAWPHAQATQVSFRSKP